MSILLKGSPLVLKTFINVLSDRKNRLAVRVEDQVFFNCSRLNEMVEERRQRWSLFGAAECKP